MSAAPEIVLNKCPECGSDLMIQTMQTFTKVVIDADGSYDLYVDGQMLTEYEALLCERYHFLERRA